MCRKYAQSWLYTYAWKTFNKYDKQTLRKPGICFSTSSISVQHMTELVDHSMFTTPVLSIAVRTCLPTWLNVKPQIALTSKHTHNHLMTLCPGLPGWAIFTHWLHKQYNISQDCASPSWGYEIKSQVQKYSCVNTHQVKWRHTVYGHNMIATVWS